METNNDNGEYVAQTTDEGLIIKSNPMLQRVSCAANRFGQIDESTAGVVNSATTQTVDALEKGDNSTSSDKRSTDNESDGFCDHLQAELAFFERVGLISGHKCGIKGTERWMASVLYALSTIPYWIGYSIEPRAAMASAVALLLVMLCWTSTAGVAGAAGKRLLMHHLSLPHAQPKKIIHRGDATSKNRISLTDVMDSNINWDDIKHMLQELSQRKTTDGNNKVIRQLNEIMKKHRQIFPYSCIANFILLAIWCPQAAMRYEDRLWAQVLCFLAIPVASACYIPVFGQLSLATAMLEMTSVLVSADVDSLSNAIVDLLLDTSIDPIQRLSRIDSALTDTRFRMVLLDKTWGNSAIGFLAAWLLLEGIYIFVAFGAPGKVEWYSRLVLTALATMPASSLVQNLTIMARPGDRWTKHLALDLSTAAITVEAQRLFQDGQSFRQILKDEHLGFTVGGSMVKTRTVLGAAATASLGLLFCLIEIQAGSS